MGISGNLLLQEICNMLPKEIMNLGIQLIETIHNQLNTFSIFLLLKSYFFIVILKLLGFWGFGARRFKLVDFGFPGAEAPGFFNALL